MDAARSREDQDLPRRGVGLCSAPPPELGLDEDGSAGDFDFDFDFGEDDDSFAPSARVPPMVSLDFRSSATFG